MLKFLLVFSILLSACGDELDREVVSSPASVNVIDLSLLNPEDIAIDVFENPYLTNDLVFENRDPNFRNSRRFLTKNDPTQKGFFIWKEGKWKAHGQWFFFEDGILQLRNSYKFGVKVGTETVYDRFGAFVSSFYHRDPEINYNPSGRCQRGRRIPIPIETALNPILPREQK